MVVLSKSVKSEVKSYLGFVSQQISGNVSSVSTEVEGIYSDVEPWVVSNGLSEDISGINGTARLGSLTDKFLREMGGVVVVRVALETVVDSF